MCCQQTAFDFSLAENISCGRPQKGCPAAWSPFKYELKQECFMEIWTLLALTGFVRL